MTEDITIRDLLIFEAQQREEDDVNAALIAHLRQRAAFGQAKYGQPLRTFDGRNTIQDALEEALDTAVYLTKLRREWEVLADLLEDCARYLGFEVPESVEGYELHLRCRDTAARLRQDVQRVGVPASAGPMERLEQMDAVGGES